MKGDSEDAPAHSPPNRIGRRSFGTLAVSLALGGCASVPVIGRLAPREIGLPARVTEPDPTTVNDTDPLQQQYDLQRALSESPLVFGNQVTLLASGSEAITAIFKAIATARDSINLEYFIFANVQSGGVDLATLLLDRLRAGVKVHMIYDDFGSDGTPPTFFEAMHQAGAKVIRFNPVNPLAVGVGWSPNERDHRKIAVIDGRIGFTGGVNMDKVYENPPSTGIPSNGSSRDAYWRDTAIRVEGPAVAELQKLFFSTWEAQHGSLPEPADYFPKLARQGVQTIRIIGSSPGDNQPLYYASLLTAMLSARRRVWLCSGYFVPPHQERETLSRIARAGLDVRIVVPAFSDVQSAVYAARAAYGDLLEAGVRVFEIHDSVVHAKLAVVDDTWTVVGSSNLDRRSVVFNNEVDAVILGHDTAVQVERVMLGYMQAASEVNLAAWTHRSLHERLEEIEARLWEYWM